MSNKTEGKCPYCPRRCNLSAPHCGRGEEYAKNRKISEGAHDHKHGHGYEHGHFHRWLRFEKGTTKETRVMAIVSYEDGADIQAEDEAYMSSEEFKQARSADLSESLWKKE